VSETGFFTRKTYTTTAEKRTDFITGVVVWFVLNAVLLGLQNLGMRIPGWMADAGSPLPEVMEGIVGNASSFGPSVVNLGVVIVLAIFRRWMAFGMLATYGIVFGLLIIMFLILTTP
jgi:hypothetical protein